MKAYRVQQSVSCLVLFGLVAADWTEYQLFSFGEISAVPSECMINVNDGLCVVTDWTVTIGYMCTVLSGTAERSAEEQTG